ncbi:MAG: glycosyltransferase [Pirellulaceae bacterium]
MIVWIESGLFVTFGSVRLLLARLVLKRANESMLEFFTKDINKREFRLSLVTTNKCLLILATLNEFENLPALVEEIGKRLPSLSLLVVDDNSLDGTRPWLEARASNESKFQFIVREDERGLGSATLTGLKYGLNNGYELIATMDADLSHAPEDLARMFETIQRRSDVGVVIGSRYVSGGKIEGWSLFRKLNSRIVNGLTRYGVGLRVHDSTGALRIYRSSLLQKVDLDSVRNSGYGYLEELLFRRKRLERNLPKCPFVLLIERMDNLKTSIREGINVLRTRQPDASPIEVGRTSFQRLFRQLAFSNGWLKYSEANEI